MKNVLIHSMSLAAYMITMGASLVKVNDDKTYVFENSKSEDEWMLEYINSNCSEFDRNIMNLKWFIKNK